jgi:ribosomal protein S24E
MVIMMDLNILKEENKPLFNRKDVSARIAYENATPSRNDIKKELAGKMKAKEELVIVTKVLTENGSPSAKIEARVYSDEKALKDIEHRFTLKRHGFAVEEKKAAPVPEPAKKKK